MPGLKAYATMPLWVNTHWNATRILNLTLFLYNFIIYLMWLCVRICVWAHVSWYMYGVQRTLSRASSFLPPCESWGSSTGCLATSSLIPQSPSVTLNLIFFTYRVSRLSNINDLNTHIYTIFMKELLTVISNYWVFMMWFTCIFCLYDFC